MTVQGVLPYYYNRVTEKGRSQVLDRCLYNTMADTPECIVQTLREIKSAHFTVCQKPWTCYSAWVNDLCRDLHKRWFELRLAAEAFYGIPPNLRPCPNRHGSYRLMELDRAVLPQFPNYRPDDSPDRLDPIGNTGYVFPRYD